VSRLISGQWRNVALTWRDVRNLPRFLAYALFFKKSHPYYGKYNPGQKLVYSLWIPAVIGISLTGLAMKFNGSFLALFAPWFNLSSIRVLHFYLAIYFVITSMLHMYLSLTESPAKLQAMFSGRLRQK
jgi:Ni/Fe-hydrogenase 1 B-type cytochrome subunit